MIFLTVSLFYVVFECINICIICKANTLMLLLFFFFMAEFAFYPPLYTPAGTHQESYLTAPEAELLTLSTVTTSSNVLSSLLMYGLSNCDGGAGPRFKLGVFNECGNRDGLTKVSARKIDMFTTCHCLYEQFLVYTTFTYTCAVTYSLPITSTLLAH